MSDFLRFQYEKIGWQIFTKIEIDMECTADFPFEFFFNSRFIWEKCFQIARKINSHTIRTSQSKFQNVIHAIEIWIFLYLILF